MKIAYIGTQPSDMGRFLAKFLIDDGCWLWTEGIDKNGYGQFHTKDKHYRAHVYSYEVFVGAIPEGMEVCHTCDTPSCIAPTHLFIGSTGDNARDRDSKSRGRNSRKTHCPSNHEYTEDNTHITPEGWRKCKECIHIRQLKGALI